MKKLLLVIITPILWGQPVITGPRIDLTHAAATAPMKMVTSLPTGSAPYIPCSPGDMVQLTTAPLGSQIYINSAVGVCVWTQQGGGGGSMVYPPAGIPTSTGSAWGAAATSSNVIGLWSGCSGSNILLGSDGICHPSGGSSGGSYTVGATSSPQTISAATHGQGINAITYCYSGPLVSSTPTGHEVYCDPQKDSSGNVIVTWGSTSVGSIQIFSSGAGPAGAAGPTGPAGPINTIEVSGTPVTVRPKLNFVAGSNVTITPTDNSVDTTTLTIASSGGGGGAIIPVTTNLIKGDGAGNGADSGILPANVIVSSGTYSNPGWITALANSKITGLTAFALVGVGSSSQFMRGDATLQTLNVVALSDGANVIVNTGSYSNPSWITALAWGKITGTPSFLTSAYTLVGNNGTSQTARNRINFIPGTNITYTIADNSGTGSTDVTINSAGGGGMVYPGAGIPVSTGSAWLTSLAGTSAQFIRADATVQNLNVAALSDGANVIVNTGSYANPAWITSLAGSKVSGLGGACSANQVAISLGSVANPTCVTITSSYVNNTIALTGGDINTSSQVVATHLASPLPIAQGGNGTSSPALIAGSNITLAGTWPSYTISANSAASTLSPAVQGAGTVSVSSTTVSGSGSNFTSVFPLCSPTCSHGESLAVYPAVTSPTGFVISTPLPQDVTYNGGEPSAALIEVSGAGFSLGVGDTITPTRSYSATLGIAGGQKEFWTVGASTITNSTGAAKLDLMIPPYPGVGSRYPYPYIYVPTGGSGPYLVMPVPANAIIGTCTGCLVISSGGVQNGTYNILANHPGASTYQAGTSVLTVNNPNGLTAGFYLIDGTTAAVSGLPVGGGACANTSSVTLAQCPVYITVFSGSGGCTPQCATATFAYPHGLSPSDSFHITGFSGWGGGTSGTVATTGSNDWPTSLTFGTSASLGIYASVGGIISLAYTANQKPVWVPISSVSSSTALTLSSSGGTIPSGASWYSAPDNVAAIQSSLSSGVDVMITAAGDYYLNNNPSNTGQADGNIVPSGPNSCPSGTTSVTWNSHFGMNGGSRLVLIHPEYAGMKFCGGKNAVFDGIHIDSMYQTATAVGGYGAVTFGVYYAEHPSVRDFYSDKSVGNLIDLEVDTQPYFRGGRLNNIAFGGCFVLAEDSQAVVSDVQCRNSVDYTGVYQQLVSQPNPMRNATLTNITEVNVGDGLFVQGPGVVASNFSIEGAWVGMTFFNAQATSGDIQLSNFLMSNCGVDWPANSIINSGLVVQAFNFLPPISLDHFRIHGGYGSGIVAINSGGGMSISNSSIEGVSQAGVVGLGLAYLKLSDSSISNSGGSGVYTQSNNESYIHDLIVKNSNLTYGSSEVTGNNGNALMSISDVTDDFRNIKIVDTQASALGYNLFTNGQTSYGRFDHIYGQITSGTFSSQLGSAGISYFTNAGYVVPTISSSTTISPVTDTIRVAGSVTISTINIPKGMNPQESVCLLPTSGSTWSTTTGGNIASASTSIVGKAMCLRWDGSVLWPSY